MGLILDNSLPIDDEREQFNLASWLRSRASEPVAVSAITLSELWFGIHVETDAPRARRRRRWMEKTFRRLEVVPFNAAEFRHIRGLEVRTCPAEVSINASEAAQELLKRS